PLCLDTLTLGYWSRRPSIDLVEIGLVEVGVDLRLRVRIALPDRLRIELHAIDRHRLADAIRPGIGEVGVETGIDRIDHPDMIAQISGQPCMLDGRNILHVDLL